MKVLLNKLGKIIAKPEWGFLGFALGCFMFFGLSGDNLWNFLMDFEWIIDASKWSLIGGAFIFGISAHKKTKQLSDEISKSISQINEKQRHTFHLSDWLTGTDLIKVFEISEDQLKQHVLNGLPAYDVDDSVYLGDTGVEPLNLATEYPWIEDKVLNLRFKKEDIEKYIKEEEMGSSLRLTLAQN